MLQILVEHLEGHNFKDYVVDEWHAMSSKWMAMYMIRRNQSCEENL